MLEEYFNLPLPRRLDIISKGTHFYKLDTPGELYKIANKQEDGDLVTCQLVSTWDNPFYIFRHVHRSMKPDTRVQEINPIEWRGFWNGIITIGGLGE